MSKIVDYARLVGELYISQRAAGLPILLPDFSTFQDEVQPFDQAGVAFRDPEPARKIG